MRVVGIVRWRTLDRLGSPIAGVEPLCEIDVDKWRPINAAEEFPTQGQVFWPSAREAFENLIVFFRAEDNRGQKDEFRVVEPHPALEIIDLRHVGAPGSVKAALAAGIKSDELHQGLVLIRCAPDLFLGPVRLVRSPSGVFTLEASTRDRVPCYSRMPPGDIRSLRDGRIERKILSGPRGTVSLGTPSGYVDWDDDKLIFRRALTAAVARAKRTGADPGLTKRLIEEAADSVVGDGGGAELQLERFRLERARELCLESTLVTQSASELAETLLQHPAIVRELDELKKKAFADRDAQMRSEIGEAQHALKATQEDLKRAKSELEEARTKARVQDAELDAAFAARLAELSKSPAKFLAEVAALRPFIVTSAASVRQTSESNGSMMPHVWTNAPRTVSDRFALQRAFVTTFRGRGIAPTQALRLHAAIVAGILPVLSGPGSMDALLAYAHVVCGSRIFVLHIAPDQLHPMSLGGDGIAPAANAARNRESPSLVVFEGANRGPTEAYLTPFLQELRVMSGGAMLASHASNVGEVQLGRNLRWAATVVDGSATLPVSRDLWSQAIALHVERSEAGSPLDDSASELAFSSELMQPGEVPLAVVEELLAGCPQASEVNACLRSYSSALSPFESDHRQLTTTLIECLLLPLAVSLPEAEDRAEALERLQKLMPARGDGSSPPLSELTKQLRRRLT